MRVVGALAAGLLGVGCFGPQLPADITCPSGACPDGLVCDEGICRDQLTPADDASATIDALAITPDAACSALTFRQGVGGYTGAIDTDIAEGAPDVPEDEDPDLSWDLDAGADLLKIALLQFGDVVGPGTNQVPAGSRIESASLTVRVINDGVAPPGALHEVLVDWAADVTWNTLGPMAGIDGDFGPRLVDLPTAMGVQMLDVTSSIQALSDGLPYRGWAFVPDNDDGVDVVSSDGVEADRPQLTVVSCVMP